jgi:hypothetical protein
MIPVKWRRTSSNQQPPKIQAVFGSTIISTDIARTREPKDEWQGLITISAGLHGSNGREYTAYFDTEENALLFRMKWL